MNTDLYPYGEANGDSLLPKKKDTVAEVYIKTGFPLRDTLQYNAFVSRLFIKNSKTV